MNKATILLKIKKIYQDPGILLWTVFSVLVVLEILSLQNSWHVLKHALYDDPGARPSKSVLVNFDAYKQAVDRITHAENYEPQGTSQANPFLTPEEVQNKPIQ